MTHKTALVLSAGGYFGAYQAGVWDSLYTRFQPDMVIGASVGALNGWPIASGCTPAQLAQEWLEPETARLLRFHAKPGLRNCWFEPEPLLAKARHIHASYSPKLPFALVVVELPWLRRRLIRAAGVDPHHLLATCSIPLLFPSVTIDGRRFTDGGMIENMPLWAAAEMGATRIIAIDALPSVTPWWVQAGSRVLRRALPQKKLPPQTEVLIIRPSEYLGTAQDAIVWKRENIERWIALGKRDADRQFRLQ